MIQNGCLDGIEQSKSLIPSLSHLLSSANNYMDNCRIIVIVSFFGDNCRIIIIISFFGVLFFDAQTDFFKMLDLSIQNASCQVYVELWNVNIAYVNFLI